MEIYGKKIIDVPKPLNHILNLWLKFNKSGWLLLDSNKGKPMKRNSLSKYITRVLGKFKDIPEMEQAADKMCHSKSTQSQYYKK